MDEWQPIETAPRVAGHRIQVEVRGKLRQAAWGKTSHLPWVGWCLADQGVESFDYIEPQPTRWLPAPPTDTGASPEPEQS
jgi:hypothetical protein